MIINVNYRESNANVDICYSDEPELTKFPKEVSVQDRTGRIRRKAVFDDEGDDNDDDELSDEEDESAADSESGEENEEDDDDVMDKPVKQTNNMVCVVLVLSKGLSLAMVPYIS